MRLTKPKKSSGEKIFFFFSAHDVDSALEKYGNKAVKNSKCFAVSPDAWSKLIELNLSPLNLEDYFPKNQSLVINQLSKRWAGSWYQGKDKIFDNLSLSLHNYFAKKLFQLVCIDNLIKVEKPDLIFLGKEEEGLKGYFVSNFETVSSIIRMVCQKYQVKLIVPRHFEFWFLKFLVQFLRLPKIGNFDLGQKRNTIIFAAHHYHLVNCLGLLTGLGKNPIFELVVVGRIGRAQKSLRRAKIKFVDFSGQIALGDLAKYLYWKLKFLLESLLTFSAREFFKYQDYNLAKLFKPKLTSLFWGDAPSLAAYNTFFNKLANERQTALLVTVTNDSTNQALVRAAKRLGIPTLEIQHGITFGGDSAYFCADKLAVWGKIPKMIYRNTGINDKKMVITGWPAFEIYRGQKNISKRINLSRPTITFLAQDPEGMSLLFMTKAPFKNLEIFFKAVSQFKNRARIVVRLHPRADERFPYVIAQKYNIDFELSANEKLEHLLLRSDIVVGQTTTATLDAIIMGKPVIYLPSMRWPAKFVEGTGAVYEAKDADDIVKFVNLIIKKGITSQMLEAQKKFVEDYCNFSQNSVDLISREIEEMINVQR